MAEARRSAAPEVLLAFAKLGVSCFGGPIAHLGYFRAEFVQRRQWLDERAFADVVGLCQFLPGPASSQAGFALGVMRAGYLGGLAAWTGFTLPSAILMVLFAYGAGSIAASPTGAGLLHGLRLMAVAIVAQAVWGMARSLCPDRTRATIAAASAVLVLLVSASVGQFAAIVAGAIAGLALCRGGPQTVPEPIALPVSRRAGAVFLAAFVVLLGVALVARRSGALGLFDAFYRSGALVFGGGHVILPLLRDAVVLPGWVSNEAFLAGYGVAQAVPGPLSSFAAYLGAVANVPPGDVAGAALALFAIYLPAILLLMGTLPFWGALRAHPSAQAAMRGVNAAVVGLLGAALYDPVWISAVHSRADFAIALAGFVLLIAWRAPPLLVVALSAASGIGLTLL